MFSEVHKRVKKAGKPPGTAIYTGDEVARETLLSLVTYDADKAVERHGKDALAHLPKMNADVITWLNVEGLNDTDTIKEIGKHYHLHPLTLEDILNVEQRPKVEEFDDYIFITLKMLIQKAEADFSIKQFSIVLGKNYIITFQELDTRLFDKLTEKICANTKMALREQGSDYLMYRLIDIVVDQYFVILETLSDKIEELEEHAFTLATPKNQQIIYQLKRQILLIRKAVWPMREALNHLQHSESNLISNFTRIYLRDVYDHVVQAIDTIETFRDILSSLLDMYLSSLTNRMNEIMKTLTIISTIFIPITAIASIYGMNFVYMPGLNSPWGYWIAIGVMLSIAAGMLIYFRRKRWIGFKTTGV